MRNILEWSTVAAIGALLLGVHYVAEERAREEQRADTMAMEVERFRAELSMRAASGLSTQLNPRGWPVTVDARWFGETPPLNLLLTGNRPWVEVAPPEHSRLLHPPVRVALTDDQASFWYNPYLGIVRARVPMLMSAQDTIKLYGRINGVGIDDLASAAPAVTSQGASTLASPALTRSDESP